MSRILIVSIGVVWVVIGVLGWSQLARAQFEGYKEAAGGGNLVYAAEANEPLIGWHTFIAAGDANLPGGCVAPAHTQTDTAATGAWIAAAACDVDAPTSIFAAEYVPACVTRTLTSLHSTAKTAMAGTSECQIRIQYFEGSRQQGTYLVLNANAASKAIGAQATLTESIELDGGSWYHVQTAISSGGICTSLDIQLDLFYSDVNAC